MWNNNSCLINFKVKTSLETFSKKMNLYVLYVQFFFSFFFGGAL